MNRAVLRALPTESKQHHVQEAPPPYDSGAMYSCFRRRASLYWKFTFSKKVLPKKQKLQIVCFWRVLFLLCGMKLNHTIYWYQLERDFYEWGNVFSDYMSVHNDRSHL